MKPGQPNTSIATSPASKVNSAAQITQLTATAEIKRRMQDREYLVDLERMLNAVFHNISPALQKDFPKKNYIDRLQKIGNLNRIDLNKYNLDALAEWETFLFNQISNISRGAKSTNVIAQIGPCCNLLKEIIKVKTDIAAAALTVNPDIVNHPWLDITPTQQLLVATLDRPRALGNKSDAARSYIEQHQQQNLNLELVQLNKANKELTSTQTQLRTARTDEKNAAKELKEFQQKITALQQARTTLSQSVIKAPLFLGLRALFGSPSAQNKIAEISAQTAAVTQAENALRTAIGEDISDNAIAAKQRALATKLTAQQEKVRQQTQDYHKKVAATQTNNILDTIAQQPNLIEKTADPRFVSMLAQQKELSHGLLQKFIENPQLVERHCVGDNESTQRQGLRNLLALFDEPQKVTLYALLVRKAPETNALRLWQTDSQFLRDTLLTDVTPADLGSLILTEQIKLVTDAKGQIQTQAPAQQPITEIIRADTDLRTEAQNIPDKKMQSAVISALAPEETKSITPTTTASAAITPTSRQTL